MALSNKERNAAPTGQGWEVTERVNWRQNKIKLAPSKPGWIESEAVAP